MNENPLASKAMLVVLRSSAWRPTKLHRDETRRENERHGLDNRALVSLRLVNSAALTNHARAIALARAEHYSLTLPTGDEGWRLVPLARMLTHSERMQSHGAKVRALADQFLAEYPALRAAAKSELGALYREEFFPSPEDIAQCFSFATQYLSVPSDSLWSQWSSEAVKQAEAELRDRVRDALQRVVERLKPGEVFRDSLVENLRDLCAIVGDLNLSGAADISAAAARIGAELAPLSPERLRTKCASREQARNIASNILATLAP